MTGALSCEKAVPPVAGAALHPSQDDPGYVHPHFTVTGQLSQHQAVHVAMRKKKQPVLSLDVEKAPAVIVIIFLPHHWSTLKHFLSWDKTTEPERERDIETESVSRTSGGTLH